MNPPYSLRAITDLAAGDHLCCLYETEEEHRAVLTPFLRQGLERGDKVLYIVDARTAEVVLGYLRDDGLEVEPYLARGQLSLLTADEAYLRQGAFDPEGMIALLRAETERALAEGYAGLRVTGEMTWALRGLPGAERLLEYEAKLNTFFPDSRCLAICQYDRRRFNPAVLLSVLATHPVAAVGTAVYDNAYYLPPADFLGPDPQGATLRQWLGNLAARKQGEEKLHRAHDELERRVQVRTAALARTNEALQAEIAERKRAEEALREMNVALANAMPGISRLDPEGRYVQVNEVYARMLGHEPTEIIGMDWKLAVHPNDRKNAIAAYRRMLSEGKAEFEARALRKDGSVFQKHVMMVRIADEGGNPIGHHCFLRDITDRKQAEEALRESEARYRSLFDGVPLGLYRTTPEGQFLDANVALAEMLGYPDRESLLAANAVDLYVNPGDRRRWQAVMEREGVVRGFEVQFRRRDATIIWVETNARPVRDPAGRVRYYEGSDQDITEGKRMEEALRESEEQVRLLLNSTAEAICGQDLQGNLIFSNPACLRLLGYDDPRDLLGRNMHALVHHTRRDSTPYPREECRIFQALQRGEGAHADDEVFWRADGTSFPAEYWSYPIRRGEGVVGYVVTFLDITERKQAEETLRALYRASLQVQEPLGLKERLDRLLQTAREVLDLDRLNILLADPEGRWLQAAASLGGEEPLEAIRIPIGPEGVGLAQAYLTRQPIVWDGRAPVPEALRLKLPYDRIEAFRSQIFAIVPLVVQGRSIGVLGADRKRSRRPLEPSTLELLQLFATQAALAIEQARLYEQAQARALRFEGLAWGARTLTTTLDVQQVLTAIVQAAVALFRDAVATVWVLEDEGWLVRLADAGSRVPAHPDRRTRMKVGEWVVGLIAQTKQPLIATDVQADPRFPAQDWYRAEELHHYVGLPLLIGDRCLGVLRVMGRGHIPFSEEEVTLLQALADQAAIALENARLFAAEQHRRRQVEAVRAVGTEITRELHLQNLLELIVRRATELLGVMSGTVYLWDEAAKVLVPQAWVGLGDWMGELRIRLGEGLSGIVAQRRAGLIVNDYRTWPAAHPLFLERTELTAAIAEPLLYRDRLLGVITIDNHGTGRLFTEQDREILALFATQAAVAIENARLFEQVRAGRERLQSLSHRLVAVQEAERRSVARELHDEIGQILTGLKLTLEMSTRLPAKAIRASLAEAQALINDLIGRVRALSLDLRPAMLDDLGLLPALLWHLERYTDQTHVRARFEHTGLGGRFPPDVETAAYRIVQEALTNVARHAGVSEVTVRVWADQDTLSIQVEDRGRGFHPEAPAAIDATSGLAGMRERAVLLGGHLTLESAPGAGTRVTAQLPLGDRAERRKKKR